MTSGLDTVPAEAEGILVVGDCQVPAAGGQQRFAMESRLRRCPADVASLRRSLATHHPRWLVIGRVEEEADAQLLVMTAWQVYPDLRLAMLGPLNDLRRCERWMRRGCHVYVADSSPFATVLA